MNRRSFLKIMGAGAGTIATFSLVPATLADVHKFAGKQSIDKVQAEMQAMDQVEDYIKSDIVRQVPTRIEERALLIGLEHHLGSDFEVVQIDRGVGRAYFPIRLHGETRTIPVTFKFHYPDANIASDFQYMIKFTEAIANSIKLYPMHLEADPSFMELAWKMHGKFGGRRVFYQV